MGIFKKAKAPNLTDAMNRSQGQYDRGIGFLNSDVPLSTFNNFGPLGSTGSGFSNGALNSSFNLNPNIQRGLNNSYSNIANLGGLQDQRAQQAYDANYNPFLQSARQQVGNLFGNLGTSGVNNSRGQYAVSALADQQNMLAGQRLYDLQNQGRQNVLNEQTAQYNLSNAPFQQLLGQQNINQGLINQNALTRATGKAQLAGQAGGSQAQLGIAQGQLQQQTNAMNAASAGGFLGGAINLLSLPFLR